MILLHLNQADHILICVDESNNEVHYWKLNPFQLCSGIQKSQVGNNMLV